MTNHADLLQQRRTCAKLLDTAFGEQATHLRHRIDEIDREIFGSSQPAALQLEDLVQQIISIADGLPNQRDVLLRSAAGSLRAACLSQLAPSDVPELSEWDALPTNVGEVSK